LGTYQITCPDTDLACSLFELASRARHPDMTWYTTGQFNHARGFYDWYRQGSGSAVDHCARAAS
jgi:hypothetical protein